jgi:hypothetical protein
MDVKSPSVSNAKIGRIRSVIIHKKSQITQYNSTGTYLVFPINNPNATSRTYSKA